MPSKSKRPAAATWGDGGWGVRVRAASRLSFTLIDLSDHGGRKNGMASLSLRDPSFEATVRPATESDVIADEVSAVYADDIRRLLSEAARRWHTPPATVTVERGLAPHTGLGSKTTTLLAVGQAYLLLSGKKVSTERLARVVKRGGTSGASVNLIDRGGFIVDGGHKAPLDLAAEPGLHLRPSGFALPARKPPVLVRLKFPPWPILMILAAGHNVHGPSEATWFEGVVPIPVEEARKTAHLILLHLAPAVAEADYEAFCRTVNVITSETYYKREQIARQSHGVRQLISEAQRRPEVDAIGMSSMGPCCYALSRRPEALVSWLEEQREAGLVERFWFTTAQNHPAVFEGVPADISSMSGETR